MTRQASAEVAIDLFTDEAIRDPYPLYRQIRDRAPAVWLPAHSVWALSRFADVRAALRADDALISGRGVGVNDFVNARVTATLLTSDGDIHRAWRGVVMRPMVPSALAEVRSQIERLADKRVADLVSQESFDGIADFARHLPVAVVSHLVGLPEAGRERMLDWAKATFNSLGPMNARGQAAGESLLEMLAYARGVERAQLRPNGWAARRRMRLPMLTLCCA